MAHNVSAMPDSKLQLERSRRLAIPAVVAASARRVPDVTALVFDERRISFAELDRRAALLAAALAERGVGAGDRVAMLMYNRIEFVEAFLGIQRLGACAVPVNFRLAAEEAAYVLEDSGSVGAIVDGALAELAPAGAGFRLMLDGAAGGDSYEEALAAADADSAPEVVVDDEDLAFLMYTSGTTGRPKGAMLTHQNLIVNTMNWVYEMGATKDDVWLSGLPLFHIGGLNGILPFLQLGSTAVIERSTGFDPARSLELLAAHRVSMCFFVPTQWQDVCAAVAASDIQLDALRVAMWGASPAPLPTLELLEETFPSVMIVSAFGQTEMSSNTAFLKGEDSIRKMGSVGKPAINVEVRVIDEAGEDVEPGEVGEIVYRGPTVMRGYFGREEATAEAFAGGWFHSGDLVRKDEEGFIYVVDRLKDMLISGGENVYPAEVERTLVKHPAVAEVAVIGIPHERWVETPMAVVVLAAGVEESVEEELIEHCRLNLAGYKKPSRIAFVEELPRNASGKVLKRSLRERYAAA